MFDSCESLTKLDLSNFDTSNVTNMLWMFYRTLNLTDLNISSFDTSNVTNMSNMFCGCAVKSLVLRHFNTSKVTDMNGMLSCCYNLEKIDISSFDTRNPHRFRQVSR